MSYGGRFCAFFRVEFVCGNPSAASDAWYYFVCGVNGLHAKYAKYRAYGHVRIGVVEYFCLLYVGLWGYFATYGVQRFGQRAPIGASQAYGYQVWQLQAIHYDGGSSAVVSFGSVRLYGGLIWNLLPLVVSTRLSIALFAGNVGFVGGRSA